MKETFEEYMRCSWCGYKFERTKENYERFQQEETLDLECPRCAHQKMYGVLHSE